MVPLANFIDSGRRQPFLGKVRESTYDKGGGSWVTWTARVSSPPNSLYAFLLVQKIASETLVLAIPIREDAVARRKIGPGGREGILARID